MAKPINRTDILTIATDRETVLEKSVETAKNAKERHQSQESLTAQRDRAKALYDSGELAKVARALNQMIQPGIELNKKSGLDKAPAKPNPGNTLGR